MPGLYTGRCIDDRILFRSTFDTPSVVAGQGITLVGGPTVDRGLSLNGTTQYAAKDQVVIPSGGAFWCKIVFTPDFAYNEDALRFILGSTAGIMAQPEIFIYRHAAVTSSTLYIISGTGGELSAIGANYGPYWLQGQRNTLIFSQGPAAGNRGVWLNGNSVVLSSSTNYVEAISATPLYVGYAASYPTYWFDGTVHEIVIGTGSLTAEEAADLYQNDETEELRTEQAVVWLPMRRIYGAGTAPSPRRTPNLGSLDAACDAYLGDNGQGGTDEPTIVSPHGFSFDGGDYLTIPHNAGLRFGDGAGTDYPWTIALSLRDFTAGSVPGFMSRNAAFYSGDVGLYAGGTSYIVWLVSYTADATGIYSYVTDGGSVTGIANGAPGTWIVTYDASKAWTGFKHYFNGVQFANVGAAAGAYLGCGNAAGNALELGRVGALGQWTTGKILEAAIFPFELTPRQVAMLSAQMKARANV